MNTHFSNKLFRIFTRVLCLFRCGFNSCTKNVCELYSLNLAYSFTVHTNQTNVGSYFEITTDVHTKHKKLHYVVYNVMLYKCYRDDKGY